MPRYEYECNTCGVYELEQRITESAKESCETCGAPVRRLISMSSFALKGGGWYADGYNAKKSTGTSESKACGAGACGTGGGCGSAEA